MNQVLYILISTIDRRMLNIKNILQPYAENIYYIISHQITRDEEQDVLHFITEVKKRNDVKYSRLEGKGVAINRNNTLEYIEPSSLCLILDDDVIVCANAFHNVIKAFYNNADADFISFKILDLDGRDYKPYPKEKCWHSLRTLTGIGTTEIAFKSDFILNNHVKFDERFGPGAEKYPLGEDFIFTMDIYHLKSKMLFLPLPIVKHPIGSTGDSLDKKIIFARGAMFARVFAYKAFAVNLFFSIKKYTAYKKEISFFSYLGLLTVGTMDYFRSDIKKESCKN